MPEPTGRRYEPVLELPGSSPFIRQLWWPLATIAERRMRFTVKVAILTADGMARRRIAKKLGVPLAEVQAALRDLEQIADRL